MWDFIERLFEVNEDDVRGMFCGLCLQPAFLNEKQFGYIWPLPPKFTLLRAEKVMVSYVTTHSNAVRCSIALPMTDEGQMGRYFIAVALKPPFKGRTMMIFHSLGNLPAGTDAVKRFARGGGSKTSAISYSTIGCTPQRREVD